MLIECCRHLIKRCPSPLTPHTVNYSACIWKWPRPPPPSSRPSCPLAFSLSLSHPLLMALAWLSPPLSHLVSRAPCAVGSGKKNSLPLQTKTPRARALALLSPEDRLPVAARSLTGGGGGTRAKVALVAAAAAVAFGALSSLPLSFPLSLAGRQALTHLFLSSFANPAPLPPAPSSLPPFLLSCSLGRSLMAPLSSCWCWRPPGRGRERPLRERDRSFVLAGKPGLVGLTPPAASLAHYYFHNCDCGRSS